MGGRFSYLRFWNHFDEALARPWYQWVLEQDYTQSSCWINPCFYFRSWKVAGPQEPDCCSASSSRNLKDVAARSGSSLRSNRSTRLSAACRWTWPLMQLQDYHLVIRVVLLTPQNCDPNFWNVNRRIEKWYRWMIPSNCRDSLRLPLFTHNDHRVLYACSLSMCSDVIHINYSQGL